MNYLRHLLVANDLQQILDELRLRLMTFAEVGLALDLDDRPLWSFCQQNSWVLITENRNQDGPNSLEATLADSWSLGQLPVLTLSNKRRFQLDRDFATRVAFDVAQILFDLT